MRKMTAEDFKKACEMAKAAHEGQRDKSGQAYIDHPMTVASFVSGYDAKVAAVLHDVLEDTDVTEHQIRETFGDLMADTLLILTHKDDETYLDYIQRVSKHPLASKVKLADLRHNMDFSRYGGHIPAMAYERMAKKYRPAWKILTGSEPRALVLSSGGVDSTTALGLAVKKYGAKNVTALGIIYGQKHDKEIEAAEAVANYYGVEKIFMDMTPIFQYSDCSLLKQSLEEIPESSYAEQLQGDSAGKPVSTYVPFRNGLFMSAAASIALSKDCQTIYYGIHADDAAGSAYPDCSEAFNEAIGRAIYLGSGNQLQIAAPFVNVSKSEVVRQGLEIGVPYHLTWSCYAGNDRPCGKCGTCIDRAKAFAANGIEDPALNKD